jgi:fructose-specific PTS system IIA-like component
MSQAPGGLAIEQKRLRDALAAVSADLEQKLGAAPAGAQAEILRAHLAISKDPALAGRLMARAGEGMSAGQAIMDAADYFSAELRASSSAYLRERVMDIQDISSQLLIQAYGEVARPAGLVLTELSIVVAVSLTPSQFLSLDRRFLAGLVLADAGITSHTVILARSFGIPALAGIAGVEARVTPGQEAIVDAGRGLLITGLTGAAIRFYDREQVAMERRAASLRLPEGRPALTADGRRVEVSANIATAAEAPLVFQAGAEGIGLFRTEMLFLDRDAPPTEDEQFGIYSDVARAAGLRSVIIRTLDIGGDKPVSYLDLPAEANPFLGLRGMRLYARYLALFRTQLRAIVRASTFGCIKIMAPMITTVDEAAWFRAQVSGVVEELSAEGVEVHRAIPVGVMLEVPAAAFVLDQLCEVVDFFSIGTNDLSQYFLAVDRGNPSVASLYSARHPAFLRLLRQTVDEIHRHGKWVGMCGEMAGDVEAVPLLVGLGLDEISLAGAGIAAVKGALARADRSDARRLLDAACSSRSPGEVSALLKEHRGTRATAPILSADLVALDSDSESREEVVREAVNCLYAAGRTDEPDRLEDAIWAREAVYATGLGHGFAIPHCKSDTVLSNSVVLLRLRQPVEWGSLDGKPVRVVIMLAMRESDRDNTHMKVFSRLARKLMHEEFRDTLSAIAEPEPAVAFLEQELDVQPQGVASSTCEA